MLDLKYLDRKLEKLEYEIALYSDSKLEPQREHAKILKRQYKAYARERLEAMKRPSMDIKDVYKGVIKPPYHRKEFEPLKPIGRRYY